MSSSGTRKRVGRRPKRRSTRKLTSRKIKEVKGFPVFKGVLTKDKKGNMCAKKKVSDKESAAYRGFDVSKKMKNTHKTIRKEMIVYDCDTGEVVLAYSPKYFDPKMIDDASIDLEKFAPLTGFRGEAAGKVDIANLKMNVRGKEGVRFHAGENTSWANVYRRTGSKVGLSNFVMSGNIGNYNRKRLNSMREATEITPGTQGLIDESVRFLKDKVPDLYKKLHKSIPDKYRYGGDASPFTTITINKNFKTAMHRDKGNLNGYAVLTASHMGNMFKGGNLHFPQYGISVPLRKGDALVANVKLLHGNDEIVYPDEDSSRISFVLYSREDFEA